VKQQRDKAANRPADLGTSRQITFGLRESIVVALIAIAISIAGALLSLG
jgi:hypothetical protein